jgi:translation elongation factor EF-1beta
MSVQRQPELTVRADLRVRVSRDGPGDLHDGVRKRLRRVEAVSAVETVDVSGLRPGLNDLAVDLVATLRLRADVGEEEEVAAGREALAEALRDGFGVERADVTEASGVESDV